MSVTKKSLEKRLQSERRKELRKVKSKEAARNRRGKEGEVFNQLMDTLPVPQDVKGALDKSSIIKLCINYIRLRGVLQDLLPDTTSGELQQEQIPSLIDISQDFVLVLSPSAEVIFITENVKRLLGLCQYDIIGTGLDTFIHQSDYTDVEDVMKGSSSSLCFTARFKCSPASKSRVGNIKTSPYKTVRFSGQRLSAADEKEFGVSGISGCLVLTGTLVEHLSPSDQLLDSMTVTCKHDLNMRLKQCDTSFTELTRYPEAYATEKSYYDLIHPGDMRSVEANFKSLYNKEIVQTDAYRLLTFGGGYVRVVTVASIVNDPKTGKQDHIISTHHFISQIEDSDVIMADVQLLHKAGQVKTEAVLPEYCDIGSGSLQDMGDITDEEDDEYDSIFNTTAACFTDVEHSDILADTGSVFESVRAADSLKTSNAGSACCNMVEMSSPDDLDALIAQLDNDYVDMNEAFFMDLPDLAEEEDLSMRAPYIPPMDVNDLSMVESCYADFESGEPLPDSSLADVSLNSSCQSTDWSTYRPSKSGDSGGGSGGSSNRPTAHVNPVYSSVDTSPSYTDTSSPWQSDQSSPLTNQTSPYKSHDQNTIHQESEQVFSPKAEISRRLLDRLVVTTDHCPTYPADSQHEGVGKGGESPGSGYNEVLGDLAAPVCLIKYSISQTSSVDKERYTYTQRKRRAIHVYQSNEPANINGEDHQSGMSALHTEDQMGYSHSILGGKLAGGRSDYRAGTSADYRYQGGSAEDSIDDLMASLECPAKRSLHSHREPFSNRRRREDNPLLGDLLQQTVT